MNRSASSRATGHASSSVPSAGLCPPVNAPPFPSVFTQPSPLPSPHPSPHQVIGQLTPIEKELLVKKLEELEACLQPGFLILNWNSLGIPEFIAACSKSINAFQQLVKQVKCGAMDWVWTRAGVDMSYSSDSSGRGAC